MRESVIQGIVGRYIRKNAVYQYDSSELAVELMRLRTKMTQSIQSYLRTKLQNLDVEPESLSGASERWGDTTARVDFVVGINAGDVCDDVIPQCQALADRVGMDIPALKGLCYTLLLEVLRSSWTTVGLAHTNTSNSERWMLSIRRAIPRRDSDVIDVWISGGYNSYPHQR
jgi:hypothetical protein